MSKTSSETLSGRLGILHLCSLSTYQRINLLTPAGWTGQVLKQIWYFRVGCCRCGCFPFRSPARSGGERSEPERSREGKEIIFAVTSPSCISCGVFQSQGRMRPAVIIQIDSPHGCLPGCRWFSKFASSQYSCFKMPFTRSARAFSALWFFSVMLIFKPAACSPHSHTRGTHTGSRDRSGESAARFA